MVAAAPPTAAGRPRGPQRRGPGRPRHADTEPRAFRSALEIFGRRGWSGLTLDGVASHAGIGKSSIYLRWNDKGELLLDAVRDLQARVPAPDTEGLGIRDLLVAHARARAVLLTGDYGPALANLCTAAAANPDVLDEIRKVDLARGMCALTEQVEEAVRGGELAPGTAVGSLLEAIEGSILVHFLVNPTATAEELRAGLEGYVTALVDHQLRPLRREPVPT
jgi:AcrR family transcriptional regulator